MLTSFYSTEGSLCVCRRGENASSASAKKHSLQKPSVQVAANELCLEMLLTEEYDHVECFLYKHKQDFYFVSDM